MSVLHVSFRVGTAEYVVPASDVLLLESFDTATSIPGSPSFVAGLVQVRGRVVAVVDLRARFGLPPIEHSIDRRIVVVQNGNRVAGLLVDSAREMMRLEANQFEKPPEVVDAQAAGFVRAIATIAKRVVLLIDVPRVIGEELSHG